MVVVEEEEEEVEVEEVEVEEVDLEEVDRVVDSVVVLVEVAVVVHVFLVSIIFCF